ncbi:tRNA pseudouridine(55) synthase TruB [Pseudobacteroides cellulosolvens]|uniref:tRNA pseudouridine synthase B n=1 Tax=Pseudobacteroides cellulosolvens ATCC 35603 = DSM 2933 TaxID=398512 RepID=A0A0L6JGB9_9FIRM|nr:tRNA pseudouridine(55) synthase TruB [Pseudobacteroides cellulosolvens]KNY24921.1 tRNA pseudouridine synthase B [Pseudobacteroides cellulosolvens ATCC 35603 = DSM 2933]
MDGIINVLKPPGMTSFDVVGYLRGVLKTSKIGHTGTLDPAAVGVLPVCIGKATKIIEYMTDKDKVYRAEMTLGIETDTQDGLGNIIAERPVNVTGDEIIRVFNDFTGKQQQIPPMYSAVKINGKKLYELARKGITVERKARDIEIYFLKIINVFGDNRILFDVGCSKGTYIRTLCSDIGQRLGTGAHMSFLVRLDAGDFKIKNALTIEEIDEYANKGTLDQYITPIDKAFYGYKYKMLDEQQEKKLMNGCIIESTGDNFTDGDLIRLYNRDKVFIAIGMVNIKNGRVLLKSKKCF